MMYIKQPLIRLRMGQTFVSLFLIAIGLIWGIPAASGSQCVDCHTNPRKLIKITRDIAKTWPVIESKSKGKG